LIYDGSLPGSPMTYGRTLIATLASLMSLYLAAAMIVDPRGIFGTKRFPDLVMDARAEKMASFARYSMKHKVDGLILGSSRSMMLSPQALSSATGCTFFNFSVDSARAEDYLAIYNWVCRAASPPRVLIIGLDVEALHNAEAYDDRLRDNVQLIQALEGGKKGRVPLSMRAESEWKKLKSIYSTQYIRDMVRSVRLRFEGPSYLPVSSFDEDGYLRNPLWDDQRQRGTYDFQGFVNVSKKEYEERFARMTGLSAERERALERLVAGARADGVQIEIWVTALHPEVARHLASCTSYPARLQETLGLLESLRSKYGVRIFDFSAPASFSGIASGWYDGGHIDAANADRVARLLADDIDKHGL
jgi:hypothetical protein